MPDLTGWVRLNRNLVGWRWYKDANTARVLLHLLLVANFKDHPFENVIIHRGEVATSYASIADALGITARQSRTAVGHLKTSGTVSVRQYPKFQVISMVSWDVYQGDVSGSEAAKSQAEVRQASTNEEGKKETNISRKRSVPVFEQDSIAYKAAKWLSESICSASPRTPAHEEKQLQKWASDIDKLHRIDGHDWETIEEVMLYARNDSFWCKNILSGGALRKQFAKLLARCDGERRKP